MKTLLLASVAALFATSVAAQTVQQSGTVTPGHPVRWVTNGIVGDGGTPQNGLLSGIGTQTNGYGYCQKSAPVTGPYNQLCLGVFNSAAAQIWLQNFGGAAAQDLIINVNGTTTTLPGNATYVAPAIKLPVDLATTANITLSGEQTIDGVLTAASRVLVKAQSTASQNGIYVTSAGAWVRATDWNTPGQVVQGTAVRVTKGALNANTIYYVATTNPITVGTTAVALTDNIGNITGTSLAIAATSLPTSFEYGSLVAVDTPLMDWRSSGTGSVYDVRLIAGGGTSTAGQGTLTLFGTFSVIGQASVATGLNLGRTASADTPFMDWRSSGLGSPYDVRLIASGGTSTQGQGTLTLAGGLTIASSVQSSVSDAPALTILPVTGLSQGIKIGQTSSGTLGYISRSNLVTIGDTVVTQSADDFYEGWSHVHHVNAGFGGGRNSFSSSLYIDGAPGVGKDTNGNYVAFQAATTATANAGGTNLTSATHGAVFGIGSVGILQNGATNYLNVTAAEFNVAAQTGSSAKFKSVIQLSGRNDDNVNGASVDAMIWVYNQANATAKFNDFILLDGTNNFWPVATTGNLFRSLGAFTIGSAFDVSSLTITDYVLKSANAYISGAGAMKSGVTVVASLPTCNAGSEGARLYVTDQATAVAYRGAVTGSGTTRQAVLCSNSAWIQD